MANGWFNDSYRHGLAARGIATRRYGASKLGKYRRTAAMLQGYSGEPRVVGPGETLERPPSVSSIIEKAKGPAQPPAKGGGLPGPGAAIGSTFETAYELELREWYDAHPADKAKMLIARKNIDVLNEKLEGESDPEKVKALTKGIASENAVIVAFDNQADKEIGLVSPRAGKEVVKEEKPKLVRARVSQLSGDEYENIKKSMIGQGYSEAQADAQIEALKGGLSRFGTYKFNPVKQTESSKGGLGTGQTYLEAMEDARKYQEAAARRRASVQRREGLGKTGGFVRGATTQEQRENAAEEKKEAEFLAKETGEKRAEIAAAMKRAKEHGDEGNK